MAASFWHELVSYVRELGKMMTDLGRSWWLRFFLIQGLALSCTWWLLRPFDDAVLKQVLHAGGVENYAAIKPVARWVSGFGDFSSFTVVVCVGLWWAGRKALHLRRLAVACLLSACLSGASAVLLRSALGRSRPISHLPDTFHGPTASAVLLAFPSGHTATSTGTALPLLLTLPKLGVPAVVVALATAWSRMHLRQHRPTDIAGGIWEAAWFGVPFGLAARALRRRELLDASLQRPKSRSSEPGRL
jgi:membrane-associated phospholipid phosphatase